MKWLFVAILTLFSLGQLGRVTIGGYPAFMYIYEILLFPAILWQGLILRNGRTLFDFKQAPETTILVSVLLVTSVLSLSGYSILQNIIAGAYLARLIGYIVWVVYGDVLMMQWHISKSLLTILVFCYIGILFASALIQYWFYPNFGNISYLGWDPHMYRLVGIFFEPPIAAAVYGLCGLSILLTYMRKKAHLLLSVCIVLGVMIFFTYSRAVMIAFSVTLAVLLLKEWPKATLFGIGFIMLLLWVLPQSSNESINLKRVTSISSRQVDYQKGITLFARHPIAGIGYNHIRFEKDLLSEVPITESFNPSHSSSSFHNSFLIILVTSGIGGLAAYLYWLWKLTKMSHFYAYVVLFLAIASCADNVLLHPFILFLIPVLGRFAGITHHDDKKQLS